MNIILFEKLDKLNYLSLKDERARHIKKILKLNIGDSFSSGVINGAKGLSYIKDFNDNEIVFSFEEDSLKSEKLHPLTLIISFVRPICMKRILREAVCLGVERIIIAGADLTEKSYSNANFYINEEYKKVLIDGAMQAAQTTISEVEIVNNIDQAITFFDDSYDKLLLDNVLEGESLSKYKPENKKCVIAIGPERGFSNRERNLFLKNGFESHTLGKRVLRSETASCAAISITLSRMELI